MREIAIIINEDEEKKVFVHDLFSFSIKYHNQSSRRNTIPESEKIIITLSTTGIWLIDEDELLIEEDGEWWDKSDELSFFLRWQNPDSINSPLTLKMLFYSIVDSIIQDRHRSCGYGHSIRIEDIGRSYSENAIREKRKEIEKVILEVLTDEFTKIDNTSSNPHANASDERMKKTPEAAERLGSHEKPCGLCVDFCQSEQEKLSIYDATQQSPELFHFCIKGFSRCICRPIDKVVKDFILSVIHSCRYIIEGFIPKFSYFAIP